MPDYRERLRLPLSWWLLGAVFAISVGWIFLVVTTWAIALTATLVVAAPLAWALWTYGSLAIEVRDGDLHVGHAHLDRRFQGRPRALDAAPYHHMMGAGADARAFILTRPYVKTGALIPVVDESDSTPYWLVSTRHPDDLVASLAHPGEDHDDNEKQDLESNQSAEAIGENTGVEEG